jgi:RNA polymerase primary sigma factor
LTDRSSATINRYFSELNHMKMVSPDQEIELAQLIRKGDKAALHQLVNANLRFVVSVAKQYQNFGIPLEDLIEEGNIGLIRAAERFDETKGFKFISYAVWWIRQRIMTSINKNGRMVRIPQNRNEQLMQIKRATTYLEQDLERVPTNEELSEKTGFSIVELELLLPFDNRTQSVDATLREDSAMKVSDVMTEEGALETNHLVIEDSLHADLKRAIDTLSGKEQQVLKMYFGIDYPTNVSLHEIGRKMGISGERVRQIRLRALKKIRKGKVASRLKEYMD